MPVNETQFILDTVTDSSEIKPFVPFLTAFFKSVLNLYFVQNGSAVTAKVPHILNQHRKIIEIIAIWLSGFLAHNVHKIMVKPQTNFAFPKTTFRIPHFY